MNIPLDTYNTLRIRTDRNDYCYHFFLANISIDCQIGRCFLAIEDKNVYMSTKDVY